MNIDLLNSDNDFATNGGESARLQSIRSDAVRIRELEAEVARLQEELRERSTELDTLFDVLPIGIGVALDAECKRIRVNRAFARVLGIEPSQNASKTADGDDRPTNFVCVDLQGRRIPDDCLPMQVSAREGKLVHDLEIDVIHEDGRIVRLLEYAAPLLDAEGRPRGSVGAFVDITERRSAEERERRRLAEIAHVSRLSTLGEMISGLAHEINQPLAAASNFARACQRWPQTAKTPVPNEVMRLVQKILSQTERAGEIVKRLTTFVRKGVSSPSLVDANSIVRDVIALTKSCLYPAMQHDIDTPLLADLATNLPKVSVDPIQIEQVLVNLIRNAIESTQDAESSAAVVIRTQLVAQAIQVSVADSGSGIESPTPTDQLFEPFFTTKPEGIGLGLSISRSIIENHGGKLWVEQNDEGGATFFFTLPLVAPSPSR